MSGAGERLWNRYIAVLASYQRRPTTATRQRLRAAHIAWVKDFCPDMADQLAEEFAARLDKHFAGKAA